MKATTNTKVFRIHEPNIKYVKNQKHCVYNYSMKSKYNLFMIFTVLTLVKTKNTLLFQKSAGAIWGQRFLMQLQKELYPRVFMLERSFTTQIEAYKNTKNFSGGFLNFVLDSLKHGPEVSINNEFWESRTFFSITYNKSLRRKFKNPSREAVDVFKGFILSGKSSL